MKRNENTALAHINQFLSNGSQPESHNDKPPVVTLPEEVTAQQKDDTESGQPSTYLPQ